MNNSKELAKQINFLVYFTSEADVKINAVLKDETIWKQFKMKGTEI